MRVKIVSGHRMDDLSELHELRSTPGMGSRKVVVPKGTIPSPLEEVGR